MPELPEVETIRRKLEPDLIGKIIKDVKVLSAKQFIGSLNALTGEKINSIGRTGKVLNIYSSHLILNIHLKMTGQLLYSPDKQHTRFRNTIPFARTDTMPGRTTRIIIHFSDGSTLFFNDLRKFGWMKITKTPEGPSSPDVLDKKFTPQYLLTITSRSKKPIKTLLMDQEKISGIGNIYANDALFLAGIKPSRKASSLNKKTIEVLHSSIKKVIRQGLKDLGSTGGDEAFVLPDGTRGNHQFHFLVYDREGQSCPTCKGKIIRLKQGGRSSFYCSKCQK